MIWLERLSQSLQQEYPDRGAVGVLATVSPEAEPAARCVICRGVKPDGRIAFVTDLRSDKIDHLRNQPAAEVVFWLPAQKLQWRIAGDARIVTGHATAVDWASLPESTRQTFFAPPPGERYEPFTVDADLTTPPPTFALLELLPDRVESLDLTTTPHTRLLYSRHEKWTERRINP